jgi:hypothetical protein
MPMKEALYVPQTFTHCAFTIPAFVNHVPNYAHYASPKINPMTGKIISYYKCLMHDTEIAEVWQTASVKDFGGMAQGENKMGRKGTNSFFVMTHTEIETAYAQKQTFTYAKIVIGFCLQKEDPHCI